MVSSPLTFRYPRQPLPRPHLLTAHMGTQLHLVFFSHQSQCSFCAFNTNPPPDQRPASPMYRMEPSSRPSVVRSLGVCVFVRCPTLPSWLMILFPISTHSALSRPCIAVSAGLSVLDAGASQNLIYPPDLQHTPGERGSSSRPLRSLVAISYMFLRMSCPYFADLKLPRARAHLQLGATVSPGIPPPTSLCLSPRNPCGDALLSLGPSFLIRLA